MDGLNAVVGDGTYAYIGDPDGLMLPGAGGELDRRLERRPEDVDGLPAQLPASASSMRTTPPVAPVRSSPKWP